MREDIKYDISKTIVVSNETISGFLLDFAPINAADALCPIASLNDIFVKLTVKRFNGHENEVFSGDLDDLLTTLYAQTPSYELIKQAFGLTYKIKVDFLGGTLRLNEKDVLRVSVNARSSAFTGLDKGKSSLVFETIPANGQNTSIPVVRSYGIGNGEVNLDRNLGKNIYRIIAALDYTATYTASAKAKIEDVNIKATNYSKDVSKEILEVENIHMHDQNPETPVAQMVLFQDKPIHDVNLKLKFTKAVDEYARILVLHSATL